MALSKTEICTNPLALGDESSSANMADLHELLANVNSEAHGIVSMQQATQLAVRHEALRDCGRRAGTARVSNRLLLAAALLAARPFA